MNILWTILIGFIIGVIAKFLMPGKDPGGFIITTLLGIAGSWVGGWISGMLGGTGTVGWIGSVLGAMLLLWIYRMMNKN
ncbi:MAG: GlsB/YeaQ/YmgE family stress response membrane protein [Gemmatimonadales bacterium]